MDACVTVGRKALAPAVDFVDVSIAFDDEPVLDGVSLGVPAGRTTVLMGPSGVGKTTLIRTLLGLYTPDSGAVLVDGREVGGLRPDELNTLRRGMGVLLGGQSVYEGSLFGSLSVFDNVVYALTAAGVESPEADERTWRILHEFDLAECAEKPPVQLSAGERRRTALAKALVADPVLLVLDDPGPAIDILNGDEILRSIERHRRRSAATCLLVTHDIDVARRLGDHLAVLLDGEVVAAGDPADLLDGARTAEELDDRFGFRGRFVSAAPSESADAARRARRQGLLMAWLLMGVLLAITVALGAVLASGLLDNPAA